jgi:cell division septation protein DedD
MEPYKILPGPADAGAAEPVPAIVEETPSDASAPPPVSAEGPLVLAGRPGFAADGPYVVQLAALQSEAAIEPAWRRLASRAPQLFAAAALDVERADLGARGVYYRVRAGYFADRANATMFCDRIRQMGQDCIVSTR